jgi:hypothetical protein
MSHKDKGIMLVQGDTSIAPIRANERPGFERSQCYEMVLGLQLLGFLAGGVSLFQQIPISSDQCVNLVVASQAAVMVRQIRSMLRKPFVLLGESYLRLSRFKTLGCISFVPNIGRSSQLIGSRHSV